MEAFFDIPNTLIFLSLVANFCFAFIVLTGDLRSPSQKYFAGVATSVILWSLVMVLFRNSNDSSILVSYARILYVSASFIPYFFLAFSRTFLRDKSPSATFLLLTAIPTVAISVISFIPSGLIAGANSTVGEPFIDFRQLPHMIYGLYLLSYFLLSYGELFYTYRGKTEVAEKRQVLFVFLGTFISTTIGVTTNLMLPMVGVFTYNWVGQAMTVIMIALISYAVFRHKLFNVQTVTTQLAVYTLCGFLMVRFLTNSTLKGYVIDAFIFSFSVFFGYLLTKSVKEVILQREKIEKLAGELQKANDQQSVLIHFITHQVKGFLTMSRNIFSLMLENTFGEMKPEMRRMTQQGFDNATKGVSTVQEILNAASIKKGTMHYDMKPFNLNVLIQEILRDLSARIEEKKLHLVTTFPEHDVLITGDRFQLHEVYKNLIDNAVRYTLKGDIHITLKVRAGTSYFAVKDSGVGMTPEDKARLFSEGGRGKDSLKVNVDSTGYGLYIVKGIVEGHKGKVWGESEGRDKGSTFIVEIPMVEKVAA